MNKIAWMLKWAFEAALFMILFAFALNNQQDTTIYFFFGTVWKTSMVIVVLSVFTLGVAIGVLGMMPRWWKYHQASHRAKRNAERGTVKNSESSGSLVSSAPNETDVQATQPTKQVLQTPADYAT